jgi:hypothetical protein
MHLLRGTPRGPETWNRILTFDAPFRGYALPRRSRFKIVNE